MNAQTYLERVEARFNSRIEVSKKKSQDYATADVLSNFKRVGSVVEIMRINELPGPLCFCFTMVILKLDRWINLLLSKKAPNNESIDDTIIDLCNYVDLTEAVSQEVKKDWAGCMGEKD